MWKFEVSKINDGSSRENGPKRLLCSDPVFPVLENNPITEEQLQKMKAAHFKRIELSDAILVVNVNHYIGNSTNREIEYAQKLGKEIRYVFDLKDGGEKNEM